MNTQPLVSILIPTYNSGAMLEPLLESIKQQVYEQCEIVVVDNNSEDDTVEIAKRYTDKVYTKGPERSAQRNHAAAMSAGDYLIVLDSDMALTPDVVADVVKAFSNDSKKLALVIPEESYGDGFWAACKKMERSFYRGVPWMEAARAFRRSAFFEHNGYDEQNTGTEDYDLPNRIEEMHGPECVGRIDSLILHNEGRLELLRSCKKKYYYGRALDVYVRKPANKSQFRKQASPLARFGLYFRSPTRLFRSPFVGLGMLFMKVCEMSSGMIGYLMRRRLTNIQKTIYK